MENKLINQNIERLDIKDNIINILKDNNITKIGQLCKKSRSDLKNIGLEKFEIDKVSIELELNGLLLR